jgi:hypothetical protein
MTATLQERSDSCTASQKQLAAFKSMVASHLRSDAEIKAEMDDDGTMILTVTEDELTGWCRVNRSGKIMGDWIY